jgi:ABC-type bacteriocin/lantibiotic exporter with double-glycine peptidase domain
LTEPRKATLNKLKLPLTRYIRMSDNKPKKITTSRVFAASTILALVISIPMITVILVMHYVIKTDVMITGIAGIITLFIAMGFSFKLSKKLAAKTNGKDLEKT